MKTLEELLDKNSAWLILRDWFASAKNHYEILPSYAEDASAALVGMQLSTRSPLGAIVYETGGVLIDHKSPGMRGGRNFARQRHDVEIGLLCGGRQESEPR